MSPVQWRLHRTDSPVGHEYVVYYQHARYLLIDGIVAGVRQIVTGLEELRRRNGEVLCTSMCVGSGMGAAGIFVNEQRS